MIDTYVQSTSLSDLAAFCAQFPNVIGPDRGQAATAEQSLENGLVLPACPALGDPVLAYACLRTSDNPILREGIELCDPETGRAVVGEWA